MCISYIPVWFAPSLSHLRFRLGRHFALYADYHRRREKRKSDESFDKRPFHPALHHRMGDVIPSPYLLEIEVLHEKRKPTGCIQSYADDLYSVFHTCGILNTLPFKARCNHTGRENNLVQFVDGIYSSF